MNGCRDLCFGDHEEAGLQAALQEQSDSSAQHVVRETCFRRWDYQISEEEHTNVRGGIGHYVQQHYYRCEQERFWQMKA